MDFDTNFAYGLAIGVSTILAIAVPVGIGAILLIGRGQFRSNKGS